MEIKGFQKVVPFENVTATATIKDPESRHFSFDVIITYYFKDGKEDSYLDYDTWYLLHRSGENLLTDFENLFERKPEEITHIHLDFNLSGKVMAEMVRIVEPKDWCNVMYLLDLAL